MQGTKDFTPSKINTVKYTVKVNGLERPFKEMDWGIDSPAGLPDNLVNAGTGIRSRTGSITWKPGTAIVTNPFQPAGDNRWTPQQGDKVVISVEINEMTYTRFVGYIKETTASLVDDTITSKITDGLSTLLTRTANIPPQCSLGRGTNLSGNWVAYQAIEQAGYGTLPPIDWDSTFLHNSFQFGTQPLVGKLKNGVSGYTATSPYGLGYGRGELSEDLHYAGEKTPTRGNNDITVFVRFGNPPHAPESSVNNLVLSMTEGAPDYTIRYDNINREVSVLQQGKTIVSKVLEENAKNNYALPLIAVTFGSKDVSLYTTNDSGGRQTVNGYGLKANSTVEKIYITGSVMGVSARYTWGFSAAVEALQQVSVEPARWHIDRGYTLKYVTRGFEDVQLKHVIDEWSNAYLGALWFDEEGILQVWDRKSLKNQKATYRDVVNSKVFSGTWEQSQDDIYGGVNVKGQVPTVSIPHNGWDYHEWRVDVWRPESPISHDNDVKNETIFVNTPTEEDWGQPDLSLDKVVNTGNFLNGSIISSVRIDKTSNKEWASDYNDDVSISATQLGQRAIKLTYNVAVSNNATVVLNTPNFSGSKVPPQWRAKETPIIRARWKSRWTDYTVKSTRKLTSDQARSHRIYTHECDWWIQSDEAKKVQQDLEAELTNPSYSFSDVEMIYNPAVQLGDVRIISNVPINGFDRTSGLSGWEANYLVRGYSESVNEYHTPSWKVNLQVISIKATS